MKHPIWTVGFIAILLIVGVPAVGMTADEAPMVATEYTNESVSIDTGTWTAVQAESPRYGDNETVYYNGSVVDESEYEWSTDNGSIRAVSGGTLDGVSSVDVTYEALDYRGITEVLFTALTPIVYVFLLALLVAGAGFALSTLATFGGGGGR